MMQTMTQHKKQKTWLTTYLVSFILLHNVALITKHDREYAEKHRMEDRTKVIESSSPPLAQSSPES